MITFIALAKGELAEGVENYLAKLGVRVQVAGKPVLTQSVSNVTYRVINARDVPRFVGNDGVPSYDFGISGFDYLLDEALAPAGTVTGFLPIKALDFGKGDVVLYSRTKKIKENPTVVMPKDIENLAKKFMDELLGVWKPFPVNGATEGYVSAGEADLGVDIMSDKNNDSNYVGTIKRNGLVILEKLLPTQAMLIGKRDYEFIDFLKAVKQSD